MRNFNVGDVVSWGKFEYTVVRTDFIGREPYVVIGNEDFYVYEKDIRSTYNPADFIEDLV